jgi:hypothetical protein
MTAVKNLFFFQTKMFNGFLLVAKPINKQIFIFAFFQQFFLLPLKLPLLLSLFFSFFRQSINQVLKFV